MNSFVIAATRHNRPPTAAIATSTPWYYLSALLYLRRNIIPLGVKVISYWVAFFARKVVRFLSSAVVYIISPIYRNLVNARVNTVLVLTSGSNGPYVTTWARMSLVMGCLSFFTKGEIVAALASNWYTIGSSNAVIKMP